MESLAATLSIISNTMERDDNLQLSSSKSWKKCDNLSTFMQNKAENPSKDGLEEAENCSFLED